MTTLTQNEIDRIRHSTFEQLHIELETQTDAETIEFLKGEIQRQSESRCERKHNSLNMRIGRQSVAGAQFTCDACEHTEFIGIRQIRREHNP